MYRFIAAATLLISSNAFALAPAEPMYSASGVNNTQTSFEMNIRIGDASIINAGHLAAEVEYADLKKGNEFNIMPRRPVSIQFMPVVKIPFIPFKIDRLIPTTMYRARVKLYSGSKLLYTTPFYYTTTLGGDPKSLVRNRMILRGLKEFSDSEHGLVGQNGTVAVDGTRYGADKGELWCSEFYAWTGVGSLKGVNGLASVKRLTKYFRDHSGLMPASKIAEVARRGDYLSLDTDQNGDANHSAMFLAVEFDEDAGQNFVWTLEGNYGNKIKVVRRPLDKVFVNLGHIMATQI